MARPNYMIERDDLIHAKAYLGNRLRDYSLQFNKELDREPANQEFLRISASRTSKENAAELNQWCDRYLNHEEWRKLKESIRKRRQRWAGNRELKTVTISAKSHKLMTELANRDQVTLSEALEFYLPKILNQPAPKRRKSGAHAK